jgi:hypothetical protein
METQRRAAAQRIMALDLDNFTGVEVVNLQGWMNKLFKHHHVQEGRAAE